MAIAAAAARAEHLKTPDTGKIIVQAADAESAALLVRGAGGTVTHGLGIIDAVAAELPADRLAELAAHPGVRRIFADGPLVTAGTPQPDTVYPSVVGADRLHSEGIKGQGVTVAVLDTGVWEGYWLARDTRSRWRILANYDAVSDVLTSTTSNDGSGHGTHVSSVIVSSGKTKRGKLYNGLAPDAGLVVVRAFDDRGRGTYADVIRGLDWIVANRDAYAIRVLNLSFSAPPRSFYWDDPLNQAVMEAWRSGIVVVASAGNTGPGPMTVGVPGNNPYVVTVGAMSDAVTPETSSDDFVATFSASGPTAEGFVKPEILAPGGHVMGIMKNDHRIGLEHPDFYVTSNSYVMSGTSQAAAVVSGVATLMLTADPSLTPDDVKCRLMATARPAIDDGGRLLYSIFRQGTGLVDAYGAVHETVTGCANRGLDVARDRAGIEHYRGRANRDALGSYYIEGLPGYEWNPSAGNTALLWGDGLLWGDAFLWSDAFMWSDGLLWVDSFLWSDSLLWSDTLLGSAGFMWSDSLTETMAINVWVEQE